VDVFREVQAGMKAPGSSGWWEQAEAELTPEQWTALLEAAAARDISHRAIAIVLGQWGHDVTVAQVGHWRRTHVG
jgi:hypothetical protein